MTSCHFTGQTASLYSCYLLQQHILGAMQSQGKLCSDPLVELRLNNMSKIVNNVKIHGLIILIASNLSNNYEKERSSRV